MVRTVGLLVSSSVTGSVDSVAQGLDESSFIAGELHVDVRSKLQSRWGSQTFAKKRSDDAARRVWIATCSPRCVVRADYAGQGGLGLLVALPGC